MNKRDMLVEDEQYAEHAWWWGRLLKEREAAATEATEDVSLHMRTTFYLWM